MQVQRGDCCLAFVPWKRDYIDLGYAIVDQHTLTVDLDNKVVTLSEVTNYEIQNKLYPIKKVESQLGLVVFFASWLLIMVVVMFVFVVVSFALSTWKFLYREEIDPENDPNYIEITCEEDLKRILEGEDFAKETEDHDTTMDKSAMADLNTSVSPVKSTNKVYPLREDKKRRTQVVK